MALLESNKIPSLLQSARTYYKERIIYGLWLFPISVYRLWRFTEDQRQGDGERKLGQLIIDQINNSIKVTPLELLLQPPSSHQIMSIDFCWVSFFFFFHNTKRRSLLNVHAGCTPFLFITTPRTSSLLFDVVLPESWFRFRWMVGWCWWLQIFEDE